VLTSDNRAQGEARRVALAPAVDRDLPACRARIGHGSEYCFCSIGRPCQQAPVVPLNSYGRPMLLVSGVVDVSVDFTVRSVAHGRESLTVRGMGGLGAFLKKQWGVVILLLGILAWAGDVIGPQVMILVAVVSVFYFLLAAPLRCIALGRQGRCRNNAQGLLRGCWIREHKWQGLKALRGVEGESQGPRTALMQDRRQMSASLGVAVGVLSAIVACADFIFK